VVEDAVGALAPGIDSGLGFLPSPSQNFFTVATDVEVTAVVIVKSLFNREY
jgi:hypothetical protein